MRKIRPKQIWVSPKFAKELKLLAVKCDKTMIDLTSQLKLEEPPKPKKKERARWIDL